MPATDWGWLVNPEELQSWTLFHDERLLAVNKPAGLLCHPSKRGPWSSLVGAAREWLGVERLHLPSRLDRETSGVVVLVKDAALASRFQVAVQHGRVDKTYLAILTGELTEGVLVDQPIGKAVNARVAVRRAVTPDGQPAQTHFEPLANAPGYTLARIELYTGRLHQIRVHAAWLGHPVAGDKIYGPDETLFLDFIESGYAGRVAAMLPLRRQALHAWLIGYRVAGEVFTFEAPLATDLVEFCQSKGLPLSAL